MRLNTLSSAKGSRKINRRLGRGIGSGLGKTSGRGHKGQKSRSGGNVSRSFEGGQMPLYRRLPKFGFNSRKEKITGEVRLSDLKKIKDDVIDLNTLKMAKVINSRLKSVKIIMSGTISRPILIKGLRVTKNARFAIETVGGKIEE